jgi:hypothetical protein
LFRTLHKWVEVAGNVCDDASDVGPPEGAVNAEVESIASKTTVGLEGPVTADPMADVPVDGTDRAGESEV